MIQAKCSSVDLNWNLCAIFILFVGFNSFPAPESVPKVPRPMSVNPFTVSMIFFQCQESVKHVVNKLLSIINHKSLADWMCVWRGYECFPSLLLGECLPEQRSITKPFHLRSRSGRGERGERVELVYFAIPTENIQYFCVCVCLRVCLKVWVFVC